MTAAAVLALSAPTCRLALTSITRRHVCEACREQRALQSLPCRLALKSIARKESSMPIGSRMHRMIKSQACLGCL